MERVHIRDIVGFIINAQESTLEGKKVYFSGEVSELKGKAESVGSIVLKSLKGADFLVSLGNEGKDLLKATQDGIRILSVDDFLDLFERTRSESHVYALSGGLAGNDKVLISAGYKVKASMLKGDQVFIQIDFGGKNTFDEWISCLGKKDFDREVYGSVKSLVEADLKDIESSGVEGEKRSLEFMKKTILLRHIDQVLKGI